MLKSLKKSSDQLVDLNFYQNAWYKQTASVEHQGRPSSAGRNANHVPADLRSAFACVSTHRAVSLPLTLT